ncbi:DUF559 domain-containing protein [Sinorhizobium meliloti]|nr:DUF559 domain-containing protein [Sinorhizobium meliloti]CCM66631.1 unnamed protein product [Sinorhizobium meliloti Rm41]MDW9761279.1 DUF559 domain-containing protein [Sinorhizobium meliloti]MQW19733.1 DUF559 domain-containing protein [Sinorhizobium meliloti]QGJ73407.1 DUF559 domain-containing protein [Sinorhizobium meliloti]
MPHADVSPEVRGSARRMRNSMTEAEAKLWNELRAHRLMGLGFRRQVPIAPPCGGDARQGRGGYAMPSTPACSS